MADQIELSYKNGSWTDISELCSEFVVEDYGINKVASAAIKLHSNYANFAGLLASHHKDFRVLIKPYGASAWYRIFYGNIWEPSGTTELSNAAKMTMILDCRSFEQRLADDTVTWDYYALQAAMSPNTLWTYKDVIDDVLLVPDSGYTTGVGLTVAAGGNMALPVDRAATFDRQTLLDAIRTIADRIGYDGYFELGALDAKKLYLYPYGTGGSVATLAHPFLQPPKWSAGSLDDVINHVLVTGGTDIGVPSDGDKFTEMGVNKYSPRIWTIGFESGGGTTSLGDVPNTNFHKVERDYGTNDYCIRGTVITTGFSMYLELNPAANAASGVTEFDCLNRFTKLHFHAIPFGINPVGLGLCGVQVKLIDASGNRIRQWQLIDGAFKALTNGKVYYYEFPVGVQCKIMEYWDAVNFYAGGPSWNYDDPAFTTFDWEHVVKVRFCIVPYSAPAGSKEWGVEIDGLQFEGGQAIDPFADYADLYNPPVKDAASIAAYGVHMQHLNDSQISSFEQAQNEGNRVLANLKNPIATLELKKTASLTSVKPSNLVTVTIAQLGITAETWRVIGEKYDWNSHRKTVHQTHILTKQTSPLPPVWSITPELRSLVK